MKHSKNVRAALRVTLAAVLTTTVITIAAPAQHQASAAGTVVTFVSDIGGLNDHGFNALGWQGTQTGAASAGWAAKAIESKSGTDYVKNLSIAAGQSKMVVAVGYLMADAILKVAKEYPKVDFTIIDSPGDPSAPNLLGNLFTPEQSSYLAGILAAGVSKTHTVGFIGGIAGPIIYAFAAGFKQGALSYDPKVKVKVAYTGSFTDQSIGKTDAAQEINAGADVIFAAAGASGLGSLSAANQKHLLGIGVDSDQHMLYPNSIISSVTKHVEVAAAAAIGAVAKGKFKGGTSYWNLKNNGVGLAPYYNLKSRVSAKVQQAIDKARADIIAGKITIKITAVSSS